MLNRKIVISSLLLLIFNGCVEYEDRKECKEANYMTFEELRKGIKVEEPREIEKAGKIYLYGDMLLVSDSQKGIHIIDNSDKNNPKNRLFLNIPGNVDIAIKDGYLYADSYRDLVVIDLNDEDNIKEVNRTIDIFNYTHEESFFENFCDFNLSNGVILGGKNVQK